MTIARIAEKLGRPWLVVLVTLVMASQIVSAEDTLRTVQLQDGGSVRGHILKEGVDHLIVDLGFEVLSIPFDEVESIEDDVRKPQPTAVAAVVATDDLYWTARNPAEQSVRENVDRCGEAVVLVRSSIGLGSGFIIHADGYVVTNHHVIAGEHDLTVTMFEKGERELRRSQFDEVRIVATNPHVDLALLKIEDAGKRALPTVPLGDSSDLRQGQAVFSIGSPLGLDRSVSQGIVSLKNRPLGGHIFIQSTAQINPGNSGGPLFNLRGEVVGVTNMKIAAQGVEGLGFAVPANALKDFLIHRDAFAFDARNPNAGFRYNAPPDPEPRTEPSLQPSE